MLQEYIRSLKRSGKPSIEERQSKRISINGQFYEYEVTSNGLKLRNHVKDAHKQEKESIPPKIISDDGDDGDDEQSLVFEMKVVPFNQHSRDHDILFNEEKHKYKIAGLNKQLQHIIISVTTLIDTIFPKFDADVAIEKMRNGRNWNPAHKMYTMTNEEIKDAWKTNGEDSSRLGTLMHAHLEDYFNKVIAIYNTTSKEELSLYIEDTSAMLLKESLWPVHVGDEILLKQQVLTFISEFPELIPYRTEWRLYDRDLFIAGTLDILFEDQNRPFKETKELHLMDWKRVKELKMDNRYEKCYSDQISVPLDNCNYNKYCVQLNLYKRLLEKNYGVKIMSMHIICFNPETGYRKYMVPLLSQIIDQVLTKRSQTVTNMIDWCLE